MHQFSTQSLLPWIFRILDSVKSTSGKCRSVYLISSFSYKKYIGLKHTEYMHLSSGYILAL